MKSRRLILFPHCLLSFQASSVAKILLSVSGRYQCIRLLEYLISFFLIVFKKFRALLHERTYTYWSSRLLTSVVTLNSSRRLFRVGYFIQIMCLSITEKLQSEKWREHRGPTHSDSRALSPCDASQTAMQSSFAFKIKQDILRLCLIAKSIVNDAHILTKKNFFALPRCNSSSSCLLPYLFSTVLKSSILLFDLLTVSYPDQQLHSECDKEPCPSPTKLSENTGSKKGTLSKIVQKLKVQWALIRAKASTSPHLDGKSSHMQQRILFTLLDLTSQVLALVLRLVFTEYRPLVDILRHQIGSYAHLCLIMCGIVSSVCSVTEVYSKDSSSA